MDGTVFVWVFASGWVARSVLVGTARKGTLAGRLSTVLLMLTAMWCVYQALT